MYKKLITTCLCAGLCGAAAIGPTYGATKCVALNSSTTCTAGPASGKLDWTASCTTNGTPVAVSGIAGCSSMDGRKIGTQSVEIKSSGTVDDNIYCWCMLTTPIETLWTFALAVETAGGCAHGCATACAGYIMNNADFRSGIFKVIPQ